MADTAEIVFACLPESAVSEAVAREVAAGGAVRTYVEMSTIGSPSMGRIAATVGARGIALVDCPVSGGPKGARAGTLSVMAAGPPDAVAVVRPGSRELGAPCSRSASVPVRRS